MPAKFSNLSSLDRLSYLAIFIVLVLAAALQLVTPLITVLFSYLVLSSICWRGKKWLAVLLFLVLVVGLFSGFVYFFRLATKALPNIVDKVIQMADAHHFDLPFTDLDSLKALAMENIKGALSSVGNFAKLATKEFVFLVMGIAIGVGIFLNPQIDLDGDRKGANLYSQLTAAIGARFHSFYLSFRQVMYAQLTISAINTTLTAIFVFGCSFKYASLVVVLTFIFGLLPIVGNIISNSIIIGIALTVSPGLAIAAFVFLVIIHKLEYFLNSKIIGDRIRHPMWLMLLALILGERLMGVPGIILAPVILSFVKIEASRVPQE